eukprot:TRINITY_DN24898_c0_g3_i4.p1 TRINITY_DN24898_c0_g3~~TRINITY_DN24898_c0_g3_i4.p1  ORF type:complete len:479 (-),score=52.83 TRINITY_DN24898_c0_g3_i4:189-1550(-)
MARCFRGSLEACLNYKHVYVEGTSDRIGLLLNHLNLWKIFQSKLIQSKQQFRGRQQNNYFCYTQIAFQQTEEVAQLEDENNKQLKQQQLLQQLQKEYLQKLQDWTFRPDDRDVQYQQILEDDQEVIFQPSPRDPCATLQQLDQWSEKYDFNLSQRTCVKWLAYDDEIEVLIGPMGVDAKAMVKKHDVRLYISDPGDYYPGIRKRIVSLIGRGHNLVSALSEFLPVLQKHQQESSDRMKKVIHQNPILQRRGALILFQALFTKETIKRVVGTEGLLAQMIQRRCDVRLFKQPKENYLPGVNTVHIDIYGRPQNVLKSLVVILGYLQGYAGEYVGDDYRKFLNQSVYKHTEAAWLGMMNRSLHFESSLKKGQYSVELSVAAEVVPKIIGEDGANLERIKRKSRAKVKIEDEAYEGQMHRVSISGELMQVMRAKAYMLVEIIKYNQNQTEQCVQTY